MHLLPDVFVLPGDGHDSFILYAPLSRVAAHVNGALARTVERLRGASADDAPPAGADPLAALRALGVVSDQPFPDLAPRSADEPFAPTSVSLFLTSRCNLGCTYCYASANESPQSMSWPAARRALDVAIANADAARKPVGVTIHGGGEATLEWDLLVRIVEHTRARARELGLRSRISLGTNGLMPIARARWLARNVDGATVSLDGPPDVHDRARPTIGGEPSWALVVRTLSVFDEGRLRYGLRLTVAREWVERLPEAIDLICCVCGAGEIQAEPLFAVGRAERQGFEAPDAPSFVAAFRRALPIARAAGRRLSYSGARLGTVTDRFCEAAGRSFAVTPAGEVSSCFEVTDASDARSEVFFWGRYDAERDSFALDQERRRAQIRLTVRGKPGCADCFCKWHCAGDCSAKLAHLGDPTDTTKNPRCIVNRVLTRDQLVRALSSTAAVQPRPAEADHAHP